MISIKIILKEKKYFAPAFLYSCFALVFSTWVVYIPFLVDKLQITEGQVGTGLFFASLGSFIMIPVSNKLTDILGVGRQAFIGFILYSTSLYGIFFANSFVWLVVALFYYGMMSAIFAIALNSLVAEIEKQAGKYIMTSSHGFWSIGGIIGASLGSFIAGKFNMPFIHITIMLTILISLQIMLHKSYVHVRGEARKQNRDKKMLLKPLFVIALIGMIMMASEGAIADWSGLYLRNVVKVKAQFLGLGYAFFSAGMTLGRFLGDALSARFGSWKLLSMSIGTSLFGFALVLTSNAIASFGGFFVIGLGFSVIVPEVYRLASNVKGVRAADGISLIAATSNVGFLVGPVMLGFVAELYSLFFSFALLSVFILTALIISIFKWRTQANV
jgi:MFS family permease